LAFFTGFIWIQRKRTAIGSLDTLLSLKIPLMHHSKKPIYMVICCTMFASAAQVLLKIGMLHPLPAVDTAHFSTFVDLALALATNFPLVAGFFFHACNALLLILALRDGELSILWPIYALSYVWVALLSMHFFGDRMNVWKGAGIALIILGVSLLGRASQRAAVRS
jgi:drug/metabolite transporter (DMT)-like permease